MNKRYLGYGAYVERDDFGNIVLTTSVGLGDDQRIVLGPEEITSFLSYLAESRNPEIRACIKSIGELYGG